MEIPTTLKHKPVIVSENYENIDGRSAYHTDAKGLSLGLAQWNDRGRVDISAKVWRYTGEKWSRQSEELPLHRVLDLAILVYLDRLDQLVCLGLELVCLDRLVRYVHEERQ